MTNFENIRSKSLEDLAKFLNEECMIDSTPWMKWWNETYCNKCEPVLVKSEDAESSLGIKPFYNEEYECAYCELNDHCKFFPNREIPNVEEIIKMWLEVEDETN